MLAVLKSQLHEYDRLIPCCCICIVTCAVSMAIYKKLLVTNRTSKALKNTLSLGTKEQRTDEMTGNPISSAYE